ncbi:MAG: ATP-binding protein, partial [Chloroflexota bacterium]
FTMLNRWNLGLQTPIYIEDVANDPNVDENTRAFLQIVHTAALIVVPLRTGDDWQGIVMFAWAEAHIFSENLREIIESSIPTAASVVAGRRSYMETLIAREQAERRSINMEAVAQVSATAATILDVDELLKTVANLAKDRFGLYHAHIYLLDEEGENLLLAAGAGEAGDTMKARGHFIAMDNPNSLVVQAARERHAVIVNDVTAAPDFLPNMLLPGTRSELALPMVVAGKLVGVLDVQDNTFNRFTDEDVRVQTALANQVAVAVENGRAFQEQQKTSDRLREVDRLKSQFLANMSHELRTPLNSIIGYSEVLLDGLDGELNAEATEDVEAIHGGGRHLLTIINDILDLAKIEAGQMFLETRETNLMTVVEDVLNTCDILARNKGLELKVHRRSEIPTVKGDAIRLKQIILNLINNAIKFTDAGSITVDLGVDANQMIKVRIIDTGMGMTPDELKGLFQQFHQVDASSTRRAGGTGLGLVITRHLVTMHGGIVEVESEKGIGTTFWFTVPVFKRSTQTVNRVVTSA